MTDQRARNDEGDPRQRVHRTVTRRAQQKLRSSRRRPPGVWFGLGMFGVVGWSVAIPSLAGVALGVWIDTTWPSQRSWTLMLIVPGVALGCLNAWYWIARERDHIEAERQAPAEPSEVNHD